MKNGVWIILLTLLSGWQCSTWAGPIVETVSKVPSKLRTPLGLRSDTVQKFTSIACYDATNGGLADCGYDFSILGLSQPASNSANNGGHSHDIDAHPTGTLKIITSAGGAASLSVRGQTTNDIVVVSHEIPKASGKIDTVLNLRVPPGWHTVYPQSFDDTHTSWQFVTRVDVGVPDLSSLPDGPSSYIKRRNPPSGDSNHTDAVAFSGTHDTLIYLAAIADAYSLLSGHPLSINDMSLPKGGIFDVDLDYEEPHNTHRTGQSADINRTEGDCVQNTTLRKAVDMIMPTIQGSYFQSRNPPSRFLCETNNHNRIHIDFDVVPPPSPSTYQ